MYPRRVGLEADGGPLVLVGVKHGGFAVYFGDSPFYHFDLAGRWQRLVREGTHYLKALDGTVEVIERIREGENLVLRRRKLSFAEAADLDDSARAMAIDLASQLDAQDLALLPPEAPGVPLQAADLRSLLELVIGWDAPAWFNQRERYTGTYGPIGFHPPDAPGALVLQATLGHTRGLAFGGAPPAEPYTRTLAEFREHGRVVRKLVGPQLLQTHNVYLAGPDTFRLPAPRILEYLQATTELFHLTDDDRPVRPVWLGDQEVHIESVHGLLDDFRPPLPSPDDWQRFAAVHLKRMTLAIDSFDPAMRESRGSAWSDEDLARAVTFLKQGRILVSLALGISANPPTQPEQVRALLESLPLSRGDRVFLIDARELSSNFTSPSPAAEIAALKTELTTMRRDRGVQVLSYSTEKQR
jgi:hypothetical protein